MNYYFWINGFTSLGVVKVINIDEAKHKVIMSQGRYTSIYSLDEEEYDGYDVAVLIIE